MEASVPWSLCRRYALLILRNLNTTATAPTLGLQDLAVPFPVSPHSLAKPMLAMDSDNASPAGAALSRHACPVCGAPDHVEKVSSLVRRNSGTVVIGGTHHPYFSSLAGSLAIPP